MATRNGRAVIFLSVLGALAACAPAQVLFTTQDDFANWGDNNGGEYFQFMPVATPDSDGSSINGLGNPTAPGAAGTAGSEEIIWQPAAGSYNYFYSPGEQTNTSFLNVVDPGSSAGTLVSYSGTITIDTTIPPAGSGTSFQIGLVLNYNNNFDAFFGGAPSGANANGFITTTIPYTINAVSGLSYFQMGIIYNSNYTGTPFYLDNITEVQGPPPVTFSDVNASWVTNGSGNWEDAPNWSSNPSIPGLVGSQIIFDNDGGSITANPTVTLSHSATATMLTFGSTSGPAVNYTIASGAPGATLAVTSEIDAFSGNHAINVPVTTSATDFIFDVLSGASLTIPSFADSSYSNIDKYDLGTVSLGATLHCSIGLDGTVTFLDGVSGGFIYGLTVYSDGIVNLGKNVWNTNSIATDSGGQGVINIPAGGTLYTAEYLSDANGDAAAETMYYSGKFTGAGSVVIGEGATSTDTTQVIFDNTAFFSGDNSGFSGTMTAGMSFPAGTTYMTEPARFTLAVTSASSLGDGSATNKVILDGGILQADASFNATQPIVVTANGGTIDTDGYPGGDKTQPMLPGGTAISFGAVSGTDPSAVLTKINPGELTVSKITGVSLVISGGTVQLAPNGTAAGASSLNGLTLAVDGNNVPQGSLDITNNTVTIAAPSGSDPISTIYGYLLTSYDGGRWDGAGIQSSSVLSQPGTSIGYADGNIDTGTTAAAGTIVIMDTWLGDLNLDGAVTSADLTTLDNNFGRSGAGVDWSTGDLNYDGQINDDDFSLLMLGAAEYKAGGSHPVPEPALAGILATFAAMPTRRRRR